MKFLIPILLVTALTTAARTDEHPRIYENVRVLCVGINQYRSLGVPELRWAEQDASGVGEVLQQRFGYEVSYLLGRKATKLAINSHIDKLKRESGPDDAVIVFFAGHGFTAELPKFGRKGFLVPYDAGVELDDSLPDPAAWSKAAIDMQQFAQTLKSIEARHVLMISDACYSGFLGKRHLLSQRLDLEALALRKSRMVMTAGTEKQIAIEDPNLEHGIFSSGVIKMLNRLDAMSATELFTEVRRYVARASNQQMLPQLTELTVDNGEFVFLAKSIEPAQVKTAIKAVDQRINERVAQRTTAEEVFEAFEAISPQFTPQAAELTKEWELRAKRFEENATLGDVNAMAGLHYVHSKGLAGEVDQEEALDWARAAFDTGLPAGKHVLGRCYYNGVGMAPARAAGLELFKSAALEQFPISCFSTAMIELPSGKYTAADKERFFNRLQIAANGGVRSATLNLGKLFITGQFGSKDIAKGVTLVKQASDAGLPGAKAYLANLTYQGLPGVIEKDSAKAQRLIIDAAQAGSSDAQVDVADFHMGNHKNSLRDFVPSKRKAVDWAELAHAQGHNQGTLQLWMLHGTGGDGLPRDDEKAGTYLDVLVERGSPEGMHFKATWLFDGHVFPQDRAAAKNLFERAALKGNNESWWGAGMCYEALAMDFPGGSAKKQGLQIEAIIRFLKSVRTGANNAAESQKALQFYRRAQPGVPTVKEAEAILKQRENSNGKPTVS